MKLNSESGASMVEFAILLPILIMILFGIIEFGIFLFNKQVITNASREGARAGIVNGLTRTPCYPEPEKESIAEIVEQYCDGYLITFGSYVSPSISCSSPSGTSSGDNLTVTAIFNYDFLVLKILGFGPVHLTANTTMKYE